MSALVLIASIVSLLTFVYGGYALWAHVRGRHRYNIYSVPKVLVGTAAVTVIGIGLLYRADGAPHDADLHVPALLASGAAVFGLMFIVNWRRSSLLLAVPALVYQVAASIGFLLALIGLIARG